MQVHLLSRWQSLDFAAEAAREREDATTSPVATRADEDGAAALPAAARVPEEVEELEEPLPAEELPAEVEEPLPAYRLPAEDDEAAPDTASSTAGIGGAAQLASGSLSPLAALCEPASPSRFSRAPEEVAAAAAASLHDRTAREIDGMERVYVLRRGQSTASAAAEHPTAEHPTAEHPAQVLRLHHGRALMTQWAEGWPPRPMAANRSAAVAVAAVPLRAQVSRGLIHRLAADRRQYVRCGRWRAEGRTLLLQWDAPQPTATVELLCRVDRRDGSHAYESVNASVGSDAAAALDGVQVAGRAAALSTATSLTPLLPPAALPPEPAAAAAVGVRFWLHDEPLLWWRPLLQCTPAWDEGLDSQNAAEVWLLDQLLVHPERTMAWQEASIIVLPMLPKTSVQASACLGTDHATRLERALAAMARHPAYARHHGHDHVLLFNYWDAWGTLGGLDSRGALVPTHRALANVSLGWHETHDAAWGLANHRHVGKCQVALPYVETPECARRTAAELQAVERSAPLYFGGAAADFDTEPGSAKCPNVAQHAIAVRGALLAPTLAAALPGAALHRVPHNLRACNGSAACEGRRKATAAVHYAQSRLCAVAAGDTPSTGRLFDAIACLCVPLVLVDDLQLPFPHATGAPAAADYGIRVPEATFLADPAAAVRAALSAPERVRLERTLVATREALAYRTRRSRVATFALRELWASCVQKVHSSARPRDKVAKC